MRAGAVCRAFSCPRRGSSSRSSGCPSVATTGGCPGMAATGCSGWRVTSGGASSRSARRSTGPAGGASSGARRVRRGVSGSRGRPVGPPCGSCRAVGCRGGTMRGGGRTVRSRGGAMRRGGGAMRRGGRATLHRREHVHRVRLHPRAKPVRWHGRPAPRHGGRARPISCQPR